MVSWNDVRASQDRPKQFVEEARRYRLGREAAGEVRGSESSSLGRRRCEASSWLRRVVTPASCAMGQCHC